MTAKEYIKKNLNVPNVLTMVRLLLVPVYIVLFVRGLKYPALIIFLVASFTDLLDGIIARKYHLITDFGKLMDPFA
ncbi:MAG: CDP-alcohol phosphatidyltransferase family protein, partial [Clostridia bacterium]